MLPFSMLQGDSAAPLQLIEFVDFECSVCRLAHDSVLREVKQTFGRRLATRLIHFPIPRHRFARLAAQAAECAAAEGSLDRFVDVVFLKQDSLGLKSWASFGFDAGVRDTSGFAKCTSGRQVNRIDSGFALAKRKRIEGTPTFILNGWRFPWTPSVEELSGVINDLLAGRTPSLAAQD